MRKGGRKKSVQNRGIVQHFSSMPRNILHNKVIEGEQDKDRKLQALLN